MLRRFWTTSNFYSVLNMLWIFSDGKKLCQDCMVNIQNNRWPGESLEYVTILIKIEHSVNMMVVGMITNDRDIMSLFIFTHGFTLNIWGLHQVSGGSSATLGVVAQGGGVAGRSYAWKQDSKPCDTNRRTQLWLSENFLDHINPKNQAT